MEILTRATSLGIELLVLLCATIKADDYVAGHWGPWGSISECSVTCGLGTMSMKRMWIHGSDEKPSEIPYTSTQVSPCTNPTFPECPQDGEWSEWMLWSSCTKACGGGLRQRERECRGQYYGGKFCEGETFDKEECSRQPCPALPKQFDMSQCKDDSNFTCTSKKMCVPLTQKCDTTVQCHDGSDEENCVDPSLLWKGNIRYDINMWRNNDAVTPYSSTVAARMFILALLILHIIH